MSDQQTPNAPDYSPVINAFNSISQHAADAGSSAMDWAKGMVAKNTDLTDLVNRGLTDTQGTFGPAADRALAGSERTRNEATDYLRGQRDRYADPSRKAADMGAAGAQAAQADEAARDASTRELESYGVNPAATRFAALDIPARLQSAATRVGAENIASRTDDALADQSNAALLNQGNTEAGIAGSQAGTAANAGTGAVNTSLANTSSGYQGLGTDLAWTGARTGAVGGQSSAMNNQFSNQADAAKIANSSSSGLGALLGTGASMLGRGGALASGGALAPLMAFEEGGAVPTGMSPTSGAAIDDVPAVGPGGPAALNAGEFVLPKDVVSWKGEEWLQKLIASARAAKQGAGAKPETKAAPQPVLA